jgi:hypothetical protein
MTFVNSNVFFQSHTATFAEPSSSQSYGSFVFGDSPDIARIRLASLDILLTELERGYKVLIPILVKIQPSGDSFLASFEEANIHASGETWAQAARHLKSLIVDIYDSLAAETAPLSRPAKTQLDALLRYVHAE